MKKKILVCKLRDLNSNDYIKYNQPIYTKMNGVYGYIVVSGFKVHFIWKDDTTMSCDDISEKFNVKYELN